MRTVKLGDISIEDVVGVAREGWPVAEITDQDEIYQKILESRTIVAEIVKKIESEGKSASTYYGINTGFGSKAGNVPLQEKDLEWVSRNLIVSHSTGVGDYLHPEIVRAGMLIRANSLAQGYSGVRVALINTLVQMLNQQVTPAIPEYGSVGASGDLAPLSHLAIVLSKPPEPSHRDAEAESGECFLRIDECDGGVDFDKRIEIDGVSYGLTSGLKAMAHKKIERLILGPKEGLALNNGTTFSAGIGVLALNDAENLARHAEITTAVSLEALLGFRDAFLPQIHAVRKRPGQMRVADDVLKMVKGSNLVDGSETEKPGRVPPQDPYSIRVAPQVIGAVWETLGFIHSILQDEINAATDNPLIFNLPQRDYPVVSGGNFHGAPIAYAMDFLAIVMTDLGSLCERRIFWMGNEKTNRGLPGYLLKDTDETPGRVSGLMISQYVAASLVSDCKTLSHPNSVDSIPTSSGQEDHVSMSMTAAMNARRVVKNITFVLGLEVLTAFIALAWRKDDAVRRLEASSSAGDVKDRHYQAALKAIAVSDAGVQLGVGSSTFLESASQWLYSDGVLPEIHTGSHDKDFYLYPYVQRCTGLVKSGKLVSDIFSASGIDL